MLSLLNLFRSARPQPRPHARRSMRPRLEILEDRFCPSGVLVATEDTLPKLGPLQAVSPTAAPLLVLSCQMNGLKSVTLSGMVVDDHPDGLVVVFSGAVSSSTTTLPDGTFRLTIEADQIGEVQARTVDANGLFSNVAMAQVVSAAPVITNFSYTVSNQVFHFTGHVTQSIYAGLAISLWGEPQRLHEAEIVTVDSNGDFALDLYLAHRPDEAGTVAARGTDCWGQQTNTLYTEVIQLF